MSKTTKLSSGTIALINKFTDDPKKFVETHDEKTIEKLLRKFSDAYYNTGEELVSDSQFDFLKESLEKINPDNKFITEVGAPVDKKEKIKLPIFMGSLNKISDKTSTEKSTREQSSHQASVETEGAEKGLEKELEKWMKKYKGNYYVSDKLDGISALIEINKDKDTVKMYTRGDGYYGQDISHLLKYVVDLDKLDKLEKAEKVFIRGELIMTKKNFNTLSDKFKNARNAMAGFVNSKKTDKNIAKLVDFVAYTVFDDKLTKEEQMNFLENLKKTKFLKHIVETSVFEPEELTIEKLSDYLSERKKKSKYEIDGIVIYDNSKAYKTCEGNPEYAFAFKSLSDYAETTVLDVVWEPSKDGLLKPKVRIKPVELVGVTVSSATAFHAKYVVENVLGPGAVIKIIRSGDVIPHILEVIKPATSGKPKMPDTPYEWGETRVNISVKDIEDGEIGSVIISKRIDHFFEKMNVKHISIGIITNLVDNGYDSVIKILDAFKNKQDKLKKIDGVGEKLVSKLETNIEESLEKASLEQFMAASHAFGSGVGERKIKLILEKYPDIIEKDWSKKEMIEKLNEIDGFSDITSEKVADNFKDFKKFYEKVNKIHDVSHILIVKKKEKTKKDGKANSLDGKTVVFTGFRNEELRKYIEENGGKVTDTVSKKTNYLVHKDDADTETTKFVKARELGTETIKLTDFCKKIDFSLE